MIRVKYNFASFLQQFFIKRDVVVVVVLPHMYVVVDDPPKVCILVYFCICLLIERTK